MPTLPDILAVPELRIVIGSIGEPDGMYCELYDLTNGAGDLLMTVTRYELDGRLTVMTEGEVPVPLIEALLCYAAVRLAPIVGPA